jgi:hypothetical protein
MTSAVLSTFYSTTPTLQIPRSFPSAHPGYGAGALQALDENLAAELAARHRPLTRNSTTATTTTTATATTTAPAPATAPARTEQSTASIDAQLVAARKTTARAKAAYEAAVAAEEGLERRRRIAVEREGRVDDGVRERREEKIRRREIALRKGSGVGVGKVIGKCGGDFEKEKTVRRIERGLKRR